MKDNKRILLAVGNRIAEEKIISWLKERLPEEEIIHDFVVHKGKILEKIEEMQPTILIYIESLAGQEDNRELIEAIGDLSPDLRIINICTARKVGDEYLHFLFTEGHYDILAGVNIGLENIANLVINPMAKAEAKKYKIKENKKFNEMEKAETNEFDDIDEILDEAENKTAKPSKTKEDNLVYTLINRIDEGRMTNEEIETIKNLKGGLKEAKKGEKESNAKLKADRLARAKEISEQNARTAEELNQIESEKHEKIMEEQKGLDQVKIEKAKLQAEIDLEVEANRIVAEIKEREKELENEKAKKTETIETKKSLMEIELLAKQLEKVNAEIEDTKASTDKTKVEIKTIEKKAEANSKLFKGVFNLKRIVLIILIATLGGYAVTFGFRYFQIHETYSFEGFLEYMTNVNVNIEFLKTEVLTVIEKLLSNIKK